MSRWAKARLRVGMAIVRFGVWLFGGSMRDVSPGRDDGSSA